MYDALLQRLTQHFQHVASELRQLVQKQDTVVCQRHFARHGHLATPDQPDIGDGVMRGAKRAGRAQQGVGAGVAGDEVEWLWSGGLPLTPPPGR